MTLIALGTALASLASALVVNMPTSGPADTSRALSGSGAVEYCTSPYVMSQNPDCTPAPPVSDDYKGEPIAVFNEKKVTTFETYVYVNVLKNDVVEKKSKARIEITAQKPKRTGVYAFVVDNKIRLRFERSQMAAMWSGAVIQYHVVDRKGRVSNETILDVTKKAV